MMAIHSQAENSVLVWGLITNSKIKNSNQNP